LGTLHGFQVGFASRISGEQPGSASHSLKIFDFQLPIA
jgi:hypothetical protein